MERSLWSLTAMGKANDIRTCSKVLINGCSASGNRPKKRSIDRLCEHFEVATAPRCAVQQDFEQVLRDILDNKLVMTQTKLLKNSSH